MLLGPDDPFPRGTRRILVAGASGSGKSTLARTIAEVRDLPYTELDSLYHGPSWVERPSFLEDVRAVAAGDDWVSEWQYDLARPVLLERAELIVWLDVPRRVSVWRVVRRTLRRRFRRERLWNDNVEGPLRHIFRDPEHIIRWAWTSHPRVAERVTGAVRARPELPVVRLRRAAEVERWLGRLSDVDGTPAPPR